MHIWKRQGHVPSRPGETHQLDNTLGEVMRFIYYNDKSLRPEEKWGEVGSEWEYSVKRVAMDIWDKISRQVL